MSSRLERAREAQRKVDLAFALRNAQNPVLPVSSGVPQPTNPVVSTDPHTAVPLLSEQCRDNPDVENTPSTAHRAVAQRTSDQQHASRENGAKSSGPVTDVGKARSSANALKHGLCSTKLQNLPPDLREEVQAEVLKFNRVHRPQNAVEERLVETAAMCHVRFMRLSQAELMRAQARARTAKAEWTTQRKNEVDALVKQLRGTGDTRPAWRALHATAHGCKALARLCREHAARLAANGPGAKIALEAIAHLIGIDRQLPTWSDLDGPLRDFWRAALALKIANLPDFLSIMRGHEDEKLFALIAADAPPPHEALDWLVAFLRAKAEKFERRARVLWHKVDRRMRNEAVDRALFDPSPEAKLLSRYINDADRGKRNALRDLERMQKAAMRAAARNEPTAAETDQRQWVASSMPPEQSPEPAPEPERATNDVPESSPERAAQPPPG